MNSCWWVKIEKTEEVKSERGERLIRVIDKYTEVGFSDAYMEKHGYPDWPPKNAKWEDPKESFVFCSTKRPAYITYDEDQKKLTAQVIVFDENGAATSGFMQGVDNIYHHVCKTNPNTQFDIDPEYETSEITLDRPTDIFDIAAPKSSAASNPPVAAKIKIDREIQVPGGAKIALGDSLDTIRQKVPFLHGCEPREDKTILCFIGAKTGAVTFKDDALVSATIFYDGTFAFKYFAWAYVQRYGYAVSYEAKVNSTVVTWEDTQTKLMVYQAMNFTGVSLNQVGIQK